jgi:hypothetical protein
MFLTTNANTKNIKNQKNSEKVLSFSAARLLILSDDHTSSKSKSATEESPPSLPSARKHQGHKTR